ncbi:MAG: dipeptide ABC transporter ATP-binding protein [Janthinobacterium lividum]
MNDASPVMLAEALTKDYAAPGGMAVRVHALRGVSFSLPRARTLAIVGESGCGKSTLARQLAMIETPSSGRLYVEGRDVGPWLGPAGLKTGLFGARAESAALRRRVQMVFQNPFASLNPRKTVSQALDEPLRINTELSRASRAERVAAALDMVGLRADHAARYPHMFSGGQRQRIAIARAMMSEPAIVVADEPVSALDVSIQAQILNLFLDLQQRFDTSYVFISHNLSVVEHLAHEVMVMYLGSAVEIGPTSQLFARPRHPYTRALMASTPVLGRAARALPVRVVTEAEQPSPMRVPGGCAFHPRCPYVTERCRQEVPLLREIDGRQVACHRADEIDFDA